MLAENINQGVIVTDVNIQTGSSIWRSEMKSLAAILVSQIQYIEFPLGAAFFLLFFFDDCYNVMNAQHKTEKSNCF